MTFEEWLETKYPTQFLTKYDIKFLKEAFEGGRSDERRFLEELASYLKIAEREVEKLEAQQEALIAAAEAVIEATERHGSVGYADRQMVHLNAVVERIKGDEE